MENPVSSNPETQAGRSPLASLIKPSGLATYSAIPDEHLRLSTLTLIYILPCLSLPHVSANGGL